MVLWSNILWHNHTGAADPVIMLEQIEIQMTKLKEEAFNRKEILDKVEKWMIACEEESWLDEYNRVRHMLLNYTIIRLRS